MSLGEVRLPDGWLSVPLSDLGTWSGGGTPSRARSSFWKDGSIPWVSPKDMKVERIHDSEDHITEEAIRASATKLIQSGSVLFVTRSGILAHTFPVAVTTVDVTVNQDLKAVTPHLGLSPDYLAWGSRALGGEILRRCSKDGTTVASIDTARLMRVELPVAPIPEQHRVVEAIDSYFTRLDDAVATLERVQRNLKKYRASVLKAAVDGRLVPTEAKLARDEGRDYEPASGLLERILVERRRRWQEAGGRGRYHEAVSPDTNDLPELPEGWCWATWSQIGLSQNGRAFPSKEYQDAGVRLLRPGNLHVSGEVSWTPKNTEHMPEKWAADFPGFIVGPDELVMNLTAQSLADEFLGRICMTGPGERCLLNQRIARLTPIVVDKRFVLWLFKAQVFRRFVNSLNTGSLIEHMFTSQLAAFVLPLPPEPEQRRIVAEVKRHMAIADAIETDIEHDLGRCARLRQSILKWAFDGKLTDQDPTDEPASALVARIKTECDVAAGARKNGDRLRRAKGSA